MMTNHDTAPPAQCSFVRERINEFADGELPSDLDTAIREHIAFCAQCRAEVELQRAYRARVSRVDSPAAPETVRDRIRSIIRGGKP